MTALTNFTSETALLSAVYYSNLPCSLNIFDLPRKLWTIFGTVTPYNNWGWLFWSGQDMQAWRSECEQCHVAQALKVALPLPLLCSCSSTMSSVAPGLAHCSSALQYFTPPRLIRDQICTHKSWLTLRLNFSVLSKRQRTVGSTLILNQEYSWSPESSREKLVGPTPLYGAAWLEEVARPVQWLLLIGRGT